MRRIYFHLVGGASGDMLLASLLNLGCPLSHLRKEFNKLHLDCRISLKNTKEGHFAKRKLHFKGRISCRYKEIVKVIKHSGLDKGIKENALGVYRIIFEAEKRVHHTKGRDIHFHHLGEIDALLEICGFFLALKYLNIKECYSSLLPLSNPAPATLEILKGKKVIIADKGYESITPTAAALLKGIEQTNSFIDFENYGIGWGNFDRNDYLIAYLCRQQLSKDKIIKIETNIDDMNPQSFESLFDNLYRQGAKEVYVEQVIMKKSRPAFVVNVLCSPQNFMKLRQVLFSHTSTFGIRYQEYLRDKLESSFIYRKTKLGKIKFRISRSPFKKEMPEYSDCLKIAKKLNLPLWEVYRQIKCF